MNIQKMKVRLALIVAAIAALAVHADTETVGGYTWTYSVNGDTAEIQSGISPKLTGVVTIPSTLGGKPVTSIGSSAFYDCNGLTSVAIPDRVTSIGDQAFAGCKGLTGVRIPAGVTSIGNGAFKVCGLTSVTIPDSVASIGASAFYDCISLESVRIGNSVTNIGAGAFCYCPSLMSVTIPDSVTSIGTSAFRECWSLANVTIGSGVKNIGDYAFSNVPVQLSVGILSIPSYIPGYTRRPPSRLASVTIPDSVTNVGVCAFSSLNGLANVTIGNGVKSVGDRAFSYCRGLASLTIPDSVTTIGEGAFKGCSSLMDMSIPDSVTSIGDEMFLSCSNLMSVTIGNGVTNIGYRAFEGCSGLRSIVVGSGNACYSSRNGLLLSKDGKTLIMGVNGDVAIPNGVTSIGNEAFEGCRGLTRVTIPDSVTSIGYYAFDNCNAAFYDTTTIPGVKMVDGWAVGYESILSGALNLTGARGIGDMAFSDCSRLTSVTIPDSVTSIGHDVFEGCRGLTSVTIPSSVTSIGYGAFSDTALAKVYVAKGDTKHVKSMLKDSGYKVSKVKFVESARGSGSGGLSDGGIADMWKKAQAVNGAAFNDDNVVGVVQVKVGKANKNGEVSVSGTIMGIDGKKLLAKGGKVAVSGGSVMATLKVTGGTTMTVMVDKDGVSGSWNGAEIWAANVGGEWTRTDSRVHVAVTSASLPAGALEELLPDGEPVIAKDGKWAFAKAVGVKWAKPKKGTPQPEIYDAESGNGLTVDTSKGGNLSGLKLIYTPKKGTFKGSFKVYALEGAGKAAKLKKYTVNVTGVVVDGVGYGVAICKKTAARWAVMVE